jgi:tRNA(Ile)-lysidine synthase TilS/MesJ
MNAPAIEAPLGKGMLRLVERAVRDFQLIRPGDRVAVGISGGKDSLALAMAMRALHRRSDFDFEWTAVHLDQHQPGFDRAGFDALCTALDLPITIISADTWSVVEAQLAPGQIPCALCGRMRRGILNRWCAENGYAALALGHHLDDAIETFFLNLLYQRRLDPLKPMTPTQDGQVRTIRPLLLIEESAIRDWCARYSIQPIACPVCDPFPHSRRRDLKTLMDGFRRLQPQVAASVRAALYGDTDPLMVLPGE